MRKSDFCICNKKKGADQLLSTFVSLHIFYSPSTSYIPNFKPLAIFCGCTARFVSDMVGDLGDRFSHGTAQLISIASLLENIWKHCQAFLNKNL